MLSHALLLTCALLGDGAEPPLLAVNSEPWSYVSPPLTGHCLQTYRLFLPPDGLERPADGWPVLVQLSLSSFEVTVDVTELVEESFLKNVADAGIAVVVARVTPSVSLDDPVWTEACSEVPELPGHGLLHPPGYVPPDLRDADVAPYDDPAYASCLKDGVMVVQHVRHLARGVEPFADEEAAVLALLDAERIAISGRSAGATPAMWTAFAADRRNEAPFAGLGGAYDEPTRVSAAVIQVGAVWFPIFRPEQVPTVGFLGVGGDSEIGVETLGQADPFESLALSPLSFEDQAANGALPVYMVYGERSVCTDYSPKQKSCGDLPLCFSGQGADGVYGVHPTWSGYAWKRRHPGRTRLVVGNPESYAQRKRVAATFIESGAVWADDLALWLLDAFASSDSDGAIDGIDAFVVPGDRVRATLAATDSRVVAFEGVAGSKLNVRAKRTDGALEPALVLRGPDGEARLLPADTVVGPSLARIKHHELDATGVWTLELANTGTGPGALKLTSSVRNPPKIVETVELTGGVDGQGLAFEAVGGTIVRSVRVKRIGTSTGGEGAAKVLPEVTALQATEGVYEFALDVLSKTSAKGARVSVKPFEVPALGTFELGLDAIPETEGPVRVRLRRVLPRGHEEYVLDA